MSFICYPIITMIAYTALMKWGLLGWIAITALLSSSLVFKGEIKGVIDKNKKAFSLEEPIDLFNLKEKILRMYDLTLEDKKWERIKAKFNTKLK